MELSVNSDMPTSRRRYQVSTDRHANSSPTTDDASKHACSFCCPLPLSHSLHTHAGLSSYVSCRLRQSPLLVPAQGGRPTCDRSELCRIIGYNTTWFFCPAQADNRSVTGTCYCGKVSNIPESTLPSRQRWNEIKLSSGTSRARGTGGIRRRIGHV